MQKVEKEKNKSKRRIAGSVKTTRADVHRKQERVNTLKEK